MSEPAPRRTKIVCTIGPSTASAEMVEQLAWSGMDAARLNFSHGNHDSHLASIQAVRRAQELIGRPLAVIADLQGPKLRIAAGAQPRSVIAGDMLVFGSGDGAAVGELGVTFDGLADVAAPGQEILIADGAVRVRVTDVRGERVETRVEVGGLVSAGKGMNLPGIQLPIPSMTEKDAADLAFALEHGVDYVALSFVRTAEDVAGLRDRIDAAGSRVRVIAKIEKGEALEHLDAIVEASDGVMVARGDLGVEIGAAEVPLVQKLIIRTARDAGRTVITATQMLESMIHQPEPTRAEASDVANAVLDGTSAVMLFGRDGGRLLPARGRRHDAPDRPGRRAVARIPGTAAPEGGRDQRDPGPCRVRHRRGARRDGDRLPDPVGLDSAARLEVPPAAADRRRVPRPGRPPAARA